MAQGKEATRDQPTRPDNDRPATVHYRMTEGIHLMKAGKVALGNWVGKVDGQTHRVYYGAPIGKVPAPVRAAMERSRVGFGVITRDDLGPTPKDRTLPASEPVQPSE